MTISHDCLDHTDLTASLRSCRICGLVTSNAAYTAKNLTDADVRAFMSSTDDYLVRVACDRALYGHTMPGCDDRSATLAIVADAMNGKLTSTADR